VQYLKWFFLTVSVGSILLAGVMVWMHEPEVLIPDTDMENKGTAGSQTRVEKPLLVERKGEKIIWRLQAESAKQEEGVMILNEPTLELFTEHQEAVLIRGTKAWFEPLQRNIEFKGDVKAEYQDWVLYSSSLRYRSKQDQVMVPGEFRLQSADTKVRGRGLRADRQTQDIFIDHDAWVRDDRQGNLIEFGGQNQP